ncbi:Protein NIF3-like protein [Golovinomyces cichoracearum]|uniref:Protein NIF3-like protein n=1 Tax=Golovinomyces cichoracearum TaxID=62708 RepID=A0A420IE16_9PEZI|nr:Protein NIF3-like protein [Golovinomyces cichoracearum]
MSVRKLFQDSLGAVSSLQIETSPFAKVVVSAIRKLYPEKLADASFDNTGLLLEAPYRPNHLNNSVLLTIDLTTAVTNEAIARKDSIIIAYHPIIFRPLKSLSLRNTQQNTLLRLAQEGISVYCPHTAVDAAEDGLNDWLADIITGKETDSSITASTRSVISPVKSAPVGFEDAGYGRIVRFQNSISLKTLLERITRGLDSKNGLSVAVPQSTSGNSKQRIGISSVGICAGSGGSMLGGLDVDVLFTGELSHHEALAAIEEGKVVITAGHSNTERNFLRRKLRHLLQEQINKEISRCSSTDSTDLSKYGNFSVDVSEVDRDPYEIVRLHDEDWK